MDRICSYNDCTGCSLCSALCPAGCISMEERELGHIYPVIDTGRCTDCGLCVRSCPSLRYGKGSPVFPSPEAAYAAWADDRDEYASSASGGAASVIARQFILSGGVVYGCSSSSMCHVRVGSEEGIADLKGSKYFQSPMAGIYRPLRKDVAGGRDVLFIGTPCQCAAVGAMFRERPDNLFLADIVCHGVPSSSLFREYVGRYLHIPPESVGRVSFRGRDGFCLKVFGKGGELLYTHRPLKGLRTEDLYYNLFMDGFTYRESCYRCRYAGIGRVSDITLGDFWGLGEGVPEHPYGVSLLLPVTSRGEFLTDRLRKGMSVFRRTVEEAAAGNAQLRHPTRKSLRVKVFRRLARLSGLRVYYALVADYILKKRLVYMFRRRKV